MRSAKGQITTFESGGRARGINLFGVITGWLNTPGTPGGSPPASLISGFLRSPGGTVTTFEAAGAGSSGTFPIAIDAFDDIAGNYFNYQDIQYGFLRNAEGDSTTISPPNSLQTTVTGLSGLGAVVGFYNELPMGAPTHSFVRDLRGNITSFDVPGGGTPSAINNFGVITGASNQQGFLRVPY